MKSGKVAPAYLFLGPEAWRRQACRKALLEAHLPDSQDREQGFTSIDLADLKLGDAMDDAASYSLFASRRLIWITSAEAALPRAVTAENPDADAISRYLGNPAPGVVLVFQCSRFDFDGDDKAKLERVRKFYSSVKAQVEFLHFTAGEARALARTLARDIQPDALDLLIEATGANASRIANEIEKLTLLAGDSAITVEHVQNLVPDARETTIFALVAALGRKDRGAALEVLDTLVRDGEYLPLALNFLATQFRFALTAREQRLSGAGAVQSYFSRQGTAMWRARAEQVAQTAAAFTEAQMCAAMGSIFQADRALRDTRPDDRTVMEQFILNLTR